ncbi:zinc/manganese transport system substrate-binding protein [Paramicrobacterium humi]|uniref:Zinc/manganese transport system substrate-binding protein n=1 Tax=Paramicrobacterium humi TaxID=640635 RepID=A0A1H4LPZ8_9MICO|nr:zinc ABC transporter substrate-binding protein [Microbacterium humi]SEB72352.1 zinc/manganese transport system substrate-binding protein [Microbacterium humi]
MPQRFPLVPIALAAASALALAGCSPTDAAGQSDGVEIVASTNVYGSIALAVAGGDAAITSIIDSSTQDPHSYAASAHDRLAVTKADIVIENGGGYDPFMDALLEGAGNPVVLRASEISGLMPDDEHDHADDEASEAEHDHVEGFNEHVWYSLEAMTRVAQRLAEELGALEPSKADTFAANSERFTGELAALLDTVHGLGDEHGGEQVLITEPVPLYLLEDAGLVNMTPAAFSEAVEEGNDVAATVVKKMLDLVDSGDIALLAYNEQTSGPLTEQVKNAAEAASVPVVSFTETLRDGDDYVSWMTANIDALTKALNA